MNIQSTNKNEEFDGNDNIAFNVWQDGNLRTLIRKQQSTVGESLMQWGLDQTLVTCAFRYNGQLLFDSNEKCKASLLQFFNDPNVHQEITTQCIQCSRGGFPNATQFSDVAFLELTTKYIDMSLFDRLRNPDRRLIADNGYMKKSMDEIFDGATSTSLVTEMLLNEESENATLYSSEEQKELLFKLFRWVCVGGALCQSDETITPYFEAIKALYRHMVNVVKREGSSDGIEVTSRVFLVKSLDKSHKPLFDRDNSNSLCIVIFHPLTRTCTYFNSEFIPFLS